MMTGVRWVTSALAAALLASAGCTPAAETQPLAMAPYSHPVSGLQVVPLRIYQNGHAHYFKVEVAASPEEQYMGLRFRDEMAADEGMIFPRTPPRIATFTMQDTRIPLDMIFIGEDGVIDLIITDTTPFEPGPFVSKEPAAAVLELKAGTTARLGITPGAKVVW